MANKTTHYSHAYAVSVTPYKEGNEFGYINDQNQTINPVNGKYTAEQRKMIKEGGFNPYASTSDKGNVPLEKGMQIVTDYNGNTQVMSEKDVRSQYTAHGKQFTPEAPTPVKKPTAKKVTGKAAVNKTAAPVKSAPAPKKTVTYKATKKGR